LQAKGEGRKASEKLGFSLPKKSKNIGFYRVWWQFGKSETFHFRKNPVFLQVFQAVLKK
jgi:hypothetical protein